jgi:hypothetical protein
MPTGDQEFMPMMTGQATVVFEAGAGLMTTLMFEQEGKMLRLIRVTTSHT